MKCLAMLLILALGGCGFIDSQLHRGPNGEDSRLEQEVKAAQPLLGPWGQLATAAATLFAGIYAAVHSKSANEGVKVLNDTDAPKA